MSRAPSPYKERGIVLINDDDERSAPVHPTDPVYLIQRRYDPAREPEQGSDSFIRVTVTPSQSPPPSPSSSVLSFNSSQSSSTPRTSASSERGGYAYSHHLPSRSQSSISSITSARSMPPMQSTRTAVGLYVYHNIKPKNMFSSASSKKQKHDAFFLNDSARASSLDNMSGESVRNDPMNPSQNFSPRATANRSRSKSISSSLRGLTGSIRRKSSMLLSTTNTPSPTFAAVYPPHPPHLTIPPPELMITPSTPTVASPLSPIELPPPESVRRMRQLHKVTRTLGENIPPELIFGSTSSSGSSPFALRQQAQEERQQRAVMFKTHNSNGSGNLSISSLTPIMTPLPVSSPDESSDYEDHDDGYPHEFSPTAGVAFEVDFSSLTVAADESQGSPDRRRRESSATFVSGESPLSFARPSILPPTPPHSMRSLPDCPEDVSPNQSPHSPISRPTSPECNPFMLSRPDTPFLDAAVPIEPDQEMFKSNLTATSRKERRQGWSGEWNREDMQDVISKLRMLK